MNSETIDIATFECIEGDGRKAAHLHGGNKGLEPCCGQHEDCGEDQYYKDHPEEAGA